MYRQPNKLDKEENTSTALRELLTWLRFVRYIPTVLQKFQVIPKWNICEQKRRSLQMYISACIAILKREILTRFMTSVRSPDSSSSGVGGSGRFGAPPIKIRQRQSVKSLRVASLITSPGKWPSYLSAYPRDESFEHCAKMTMTNLTTVWKEKIRDCSDGNRDCSGTTWRRTKHT